MEKNKDQSFLQKSTGTYKIIIFKEPQVLMTHATCLKVRSRVSAFNFNGCLSTKHGSVQESNLNPFKPNGISQSINWTSPFTF